MLPCAWWIFKRRLILMLGEKLAELVNFIGEDKAEALSVHSAIESSFHVCYLNRKCLGYAIGLLSWKYDWPARIKSFSKTQCCFPLVLCMFCLFHVFILLKCWHLAENMLLFPKVPLILWIGYKSSTRCGRVHFEHRHRKCEVVAQYHVQTAYEGFKVQYEESRV